MKKKFHNILLISGVLLSTYACGPVYKCGESKPAGGFVGGNRLTDVVNERDALCELSEVHEETIQQLTKKNLTLRDENDSLMTRNKEMIGEYNALDNKYKGLQGDYAQLKETNLSLREQYSSSVTENLTQGHLYDERLKEKERRLNIRENEVLEREKKIKELEAEIARRDSITNRLNQMLKNALLGFEADELSIEIKNGKVYISMSDKLMFQSGKTDVQAKGKEALEKMGKILAKDDNFEILVEGHTDNIPIKTAQFSDNWDLSTARATAVVRILLSGGEIKPSRLAAAGKGEFEPKVSNDTPEGRAKNRRTEIILSPNLSELMNYLEK